MFMLVIGGYGDSGISGMLYISSVVKTDLNWLFKVYMCDRDQELHYVTTKTLLLSDHVTYMASYTFAYRYYNILIYN